MCSIFDADETDAVLLIYASNAFNALNRAAALHYILVLCPTLATYVINADNLRVFSLQAVKNLILQRAPHRVTLWPRAYTP